MSTFVTVGNMRKSFIRLIDAVLEHKDILSEPIVIQHGHSSARSNDDCLWVPFMNMEEFERAIYTSDILIMHAGSGSLIHTILAGKIPVIMPRQKKHDEHVDDHQIELAQAFSGKNKTVISMKADDLPGAINKAKKLQSNINSNKETDANEMYKLVEQAMFVN